MELFTGIENLFKLALLFALNEEDLTLIHGFSEAGVGATDIQAKSPTPQVSAIESRLHTF